MPAVKPPSPNLSAANDAGAYAQHFGRLITPGMEALIDPNDPNDPIAAQFVPSEAENTVTEGERADPIGDQAFSPIEGIVHRYPDRVLLKLLHTCAVHCRFCFRREQIGAPENALNDAAIENALSYIREHPEIWEVILTGGDPLLLSTRRIKDVVERLNAIPHVRTLRIHTRIPVVDPVRITPELIVALRGRCPTYVLVHCNHPRELTEEARAACARLADSGISLLSQSVLLRGVNDDVETLAELMRAFVETRITPHYLHHGDMVRGTGHFRVPLKRGQELMRGLRGHRSGLCQPRYMLDIPGGHGKSPVDPVFARPIDDTAQSRLRAPSAKRVLGAQSSRASQIWIIEDYQGKKHLYKDSLPDAEDETA